MNISRSNGFTIVEVLVAMVVLSISVLSLGILQLSALQNTQSGQMRSQASILASDIIDSMRANIPAVTNGDYAITLATPTPFGVNCYGAAANCTTTQMATSDIIRWRIVLGNHLPTGNGEITTADIGGTTQVTVTIEWVDPYSAEIGNEQLALLAVLTQ